MTTQQHPQAGFEPAPSAEAEVSLSRGTSVIQPGKNYQGVPLPQIEELMNIHTEVPVRLQRRNAKGQIATIVSGLVVPTEDLTTIESWMKAKWGGGSMRCEVRDPSFPSRTLFSFDFVIEGMPLHNSELASNTPAAGGVAPTSYNAPAGYGQARPTAIPAGLPTKAWLDNLTPPERAAYLASAGANAPTAAFSSDQIAMRMAEETRAELERLRKEAAMRDAAHQAELKRIQEEAAAAREAAKEAAHQAELKALSAKIDAMNTRPAEKGWGDMITAFAPLVPLGIAMVEQRSAATRAQLEHQQAAFQAMITAATPKQVPQNDATKELLTIAAPLLMPIISKMMDRDSPESQAKLFSALAEQQLNTVSMMAQLVESTAPPPESAIGAAVKQGLEGIKQMGLAYLASQGGLPGQLPASPRPAGTLRSPPQNVGGSYGTADAADGEVVDTPPPQSTRQAAPQEPPKPPPAEVEALFGMLPSDFQTFEWRTILTRMHTDPPAPAEHVAELLAGHLEHLINFKALPAILAPLATEPRATLEAILEKLPIGMTKPDYAREVLDKTLTFLMEDNYLPRPPIEVVSDDENDENAADNAAEE